MRPGKSGKRKLRTAVLILLLLLCSLGIAVKITEPLSTKNPIIDITKRIIAQGAAWVMKFYDPYSKKTLKASNGYQPSLDKQGRTGKDELVDYLARFKDGIKVIEFNNRDISKAALNFDYQPFEEKKLKILKTEFALDKVIAPAKSEFEQQVLLMSWLRNQWIYGFPQGVSYNFDGLDILRRARKGERFFCSEYATTYVQCALSLGFQARYVGLFGGHVTAEIWSNEYEKWITMDPTINCYYVKDNIPLHVLELHRLYNSKGMEGVGVVRRKVRDPDNLSNERLFNYYIDGFYVRMRNDWFSNKYPHWYPKANSIMNGLEWRDEYSRDSIINAWETEEEEELYFPLNITRLMVEDVKMAEEAVVKVALNTVTPNFSHFLIEIDGKDVFTTGGHHLSWRLHKGMNSLTVASVNKFEDKGIESKIVLRCR